MTKDLILIRGVSGSGKSTLADVLANEFHPVFSADDYFMVGNGYNFDPTRLKEAHAQCHARTEEAMKNALDNDIIIVANTFTREWEMKSYLDLAEKYNFRVHTIIVENRHGGKNIHGVDDNKIQAMKDRFEIKL